MKNAIYTFFILLFCFPFTGKSGPIDTNYIERNLNKFSFRILATDKINNLVIRPPADAPAGMDKIKYSPNLNTTAGIGATYKNIALNLSFKLKGTERDSKNYGETDFKDLALNLYLRNLYFSLYFRSYDGFFMRNPQNVYTNWDQTLPNPQRNDLSLKSTGVEMYYTLNREKYSLNAIYKFTERQLKSTGSVLLHGELNYLEIKSDSSLVPSFISSYYYNGFQGGEFPSLTISVGYSYCLVYKRFYLAPTILSGIGYIQRNITSQNAPDVFKEDWLSNTFIRVCGGYNGKVFYAGVFFDTQAVFLKEAQIGFRTSDFSFRVMLGYKFKKRSE